MSIAIPPLSQSKQALLSCPLQYVEVVIGGKEAAPSQAATRGLFVHRVLCDYVKHLQNTKQRKDLEYFARSMKGVPPDAREILEGQADRIELDPEQIYAAELHCKIGEDFEGTLDLVLVENPSAATIIDWKSQFFAMDPDTFQGKLYSLFLFDMNPQFEVVTFELRFVRWGGKSRSITFTRDDVPMLQAEAQRWRDLQVSLHKYHHLGDVDAQAGAHCIYCPLLSNGCPIENNPAKSPEEALQKVLYFQEAIKAHSDILREYCKETPVSVKDGRGIEYRAEWGLTDSKKFGIECLPTIQKWDKAQKDNVLSKVSLSGLGTPLRAKKREDLADELANFCEVVPKPRFKIGKAGEQTEDGDDE